MAAELPYLNSYKNVSVLFERIATAKIPDAFTHKFLRETIGLKGTGDRSLISLLRSLGFIDASNKPTPSYSTLKNPPLAKKAIGSGVKQAYKPLFDARENADKLSSEDLKGLIAQVAGSDSGMTQKIVGTFSALVKIADLTSAMEVKKGTPSPPSEGNIKPSGDDKINGDKLNPEFHYNIQIHLPSNASEETYLNIFNAIRKVFR